MRPREMMDEESATSSVSHTRDLSNSTNYSSGVDSLRSTRAVPRAGNPLYKRALARVQRLAL